MIEGVGGGRRSVALPQIAPQHPVAHIPLCQYKLNIPFFFYKLVHARQPLPLTLNRRSGPYSRPVNSSLRFLCVYFGVSPFSGSDYNPTSRYLYRLICYIVEAPWFLLIRAVWILWVLSCKLVSPSLSLEPKLISKYLWIGLSFTLQMTIYLPWALRSYTIKSPRPQLKYPMSSYPSSISEGCNTILWEPIIN